jgi:hypothetical protein
VRRGLSSLLWRIDCFPGGGGGGGTEEQEYEEQEQCIQGKRNERSGRKRRSWGRRFWKTVSGSTVSHEEYHGSTRPQSNTKKQLDTKNHSSSTLKGALYPIYPIGLSAMEGQVTGPAEVRMTCPFHDASRAPVVMRSGSTFLSTSFLFTWLGCRGSP